MRKEQIFEFVYLGNLPALERLLTARPELVGVRGHDGATPLHVACREQRVETVEYLLAMGASAKARDDAGVPSVHYAVGNDSDGESALLLVRMLAHHGSDIFAPAGPSTETLLHRAARNGHCRLAAFLLSEAKSRWQSASSQSALKALRHRSDPRGGSCTVSSKKSLELTAKSGGSVGMRSDEQTTTRGGDKSLVSMVSLRSSGDEASQRADDDAMSASPSDGLTDGGRRDRSLRRRRRRERRLHIQFTPQQFLDLRTARGETALFLACRGSRYTMVKYLLSMNPDVGVRAENGQVALDVTRHWTSTAVNRALRAKLRPPPPLAVQGREGVPLLVFTPCGASSPCSIPATSPRGQQGGGGGASQLERGEQWPRGASPPHAARGARFGTGTVGGGGAPGRLSPPRDGSADRPLTPVVDLMLEFAREEAQVLSDDLARRREAFEQQMAERTPPRGGRGRSRTASPPRQDTGTASRAKAKAAAATGRRRAADAPVEDSDGSSSGSSPASPSEEVEVDEGMAPYHRLLHRLDCIALKARGDLDGIQALIQETQQELVDAGGDIPDAIPHISGDPAMSTVTSRAQFATSAPIRDMMRRVAELEVTAESRVAHEGRPNDMALVLRVVILAFMVYWLFDTCAVLLLWAGHPTVV